ncbi:MAG TPA: helix-turn-helix domain-containing protein [Polyangiaceae bacterium]
MIVASRRRVDWPVILGGDVPKPAIIGAPRDDELSAVLSAFDELLIFDDQDAMLRRAVELARERIGLVRAGVFLYDERKRAMLGTWGMDLSGRIVDEHRVMYEVGANDLEVFRRAAVEGIHYTVFDNCPIVEQLEHETRVLGRGWVACTPIRSARANFGMLFNDAAGSDAPVDETKQARTAVLCSLLGTILDFARPEPERASRSPSERHPSIVEAVGLLAKDPSLSGTTLAERLELSLSRLARLFKRETGVSLVEYRNRIRLERFQMLVDTGGENLLEAALASGFGSYAQFHRVFRAWRGTTPREYLQARQREHSRTAR